MLRASADAVGEPVDAVAAINGDDVGESVPHGPLLIELVDAVVAADPDRLEQARALLAEQATASAVSEAVAVIANFEMMTRIADATGARMPSERLASTASERDRLGVDRFSSFR